MSAFKTTPRLDEIMQLPLIAQRTPEWFELRKSKLTGSIIDTVLKTNPYQTAEALVCEKAGMPNNFSGNQATQHGTKYEPFAVTEYEKRTHRKVLEFGLIAHATHPQLAYSPDGVSVDPSGRTAPILLEIKCPLRRKITDKVPSYYQHQLNLGMDVFDLDMTHFVQFKPSEVFGEEVFHLTEVKRVRGWLDAHAQTIEQFWQEVEKWKQIGWYKHPTAIRVLEEGRLHEFMEQWL